VFVDRISDLLELGELLHKGRRLRGKRAFVVSTSIDKEISAAFLSAFRDTFNYLGMEFGGVLHANCLGGYVAEKYERDVQAFVSRLAASD
jgi:hypothetical protein